MWFTKHTAPIDLICRYDKLQLSIPGPQWPKLFTITQCHTSPIVTFIEDMTTVTKWTLRKEGFVNTVDINVVVIVNFG